jgi:hypothetical protein
MQLLPPAGTLLYKYLSPENALRVLSNGKLRFSPLIEFNDPFELSTYPSKSFDEMEFGYQLCCSILEVIQNKETISGTNAVCDLVRLYQEGRFGDMTPELFAKWMGRMMAEKKIIRTPSPHTKLVHLRLSKIMGALCLSETHDQILMWSHYASNHQGIALGIDPAKGGQAFKFIRPVEYRSDYPADEDAKIYADSFLGRQRVATADGLESVKTMMFTKSEHWGYEREWRAVRSHDGDPNGDHKKYDINSQLVEIPSDAFCSIYVGCRTDPAFAEEVVSKARLLNPSINAFTTRISTRCYGLEFRPYGESWTEEYPTDDSTILT